MDVLITVKVDQAEALQTIMDLQELGYTLAGFDVGSVVVPLPKKKALPQAGTKWSANTRVRLKRIPRALRNRGLLAPILSDLGVGWEGTYEELREIIAKRRPGAVESAIRGYRADIKNAGCLEVLS